MRRTGSLIAIWLSLSLGCGGGDAPTTVAGPGGDGAGGEGNGEGANAAPPVPCAILVESEETSRLLGEPPDNARANDLRLENLPDRAQELEGQLVRTQGVVEAVGRDGKWIVVYDALFEGWGFMVVKGTPITIPAGARGCQVRLEGTFERVRLEENEAELMKREGRPEESFQEQGPDLQIRLLGLELTPPRER